MQLQLVPVIRHNDGVQRCYLHVWLLPGR
jgi:hypothetical protein